MKPRMSAVIYTVSWTDLATKYKKASHIPIPVTEADIFKISPGFPAGFTNVAARSVETPVIYCPLVASAREPIVSVRDIISPP